MAGRGKIENLLPPWKPGESGNPGGRPKQRPVSERYAVIAETLLPEKQRLKLGLAKGSTYADAIARKLFDAAIEGKVQAAREIREGIEGKSTQRLEEEKSSMSVEKTGILVQIVHVGESSHAGTESASAPDNSEVKKSE